MSETVVPLRRRKSRDPEFPEGFDVGARVALKSGGAIMTIVARFPNAPISVHCEWHTNEFYPQEKTYPVVCLQLASEDDEIDEVDAAEAP